MDTVSVDVKNKKATVKLKEGATVTKDAVVKAFFPWGTEGGLFKMKTDSMSQEITGVGTAAEPQLKW